MSDEVAPFAPEPLTLDQARDNLETAIRDYNSAINAGSDLPPSVVAHWAIAVDERSFTDVGVVAGVCVLEPSEQPEWITHGLLRAVLEMGQFAVADYDEDED